MAQLRFGTDGVRARAFEELTEDFARALGQAAAGVLEGSQVVIGRDTRASGPALRDALAAGFYAGGVDVIDLGVAPTPAVAHVAAERRAIGAMISASHNPWYDNGIKCFTSDGAKLSDFEQAAIEAALEDLLEAPPVLGGEPVPPITAAPFEVGAWTRTVSASTEADLTGLRLVVDAAHGAASHLAGPVLADLGAAVDLICAAPDGRNINDGCGSTHPGPLAARVVETGADIGIAFDGDADRLVCVDHLGRVVDGDHLMAILAVDLHERGELRDDVVVVTVMSNLGFHKAMERAGLRVEVTPVGDRHILEALSANRWSFGGEQSGHLIFRDLASTGDGLLSAVQLLSVLVRRGDSLAALADTAMTSFPQVLINVPVAERVEDPAGLLRAEIHDAEQELGADGRVLIRASGTEPLVRVMVEAATDAVAQRTAENLAAVVGQRLG